MGYNNDLLRSELEAIKNQRYKLLFIYLSSINSNQLLHFIEDAGIPIINVSLILSDKLRRINSVKRPFEVAKSLKQTINEQQKEIVCLYNIEYLFDPELKQNPVKLLESLSGNTIILVIWPGTVQQGVLYYATTEHPEYYRNDEYSNRVFSY